MNKLALVLVLCFSLCLGIFLRAEQGGLLNQQPSPPKQTTEAVPPDTVPAIDPPAPQDTASPDQSSGEPLLEDTFFPVSSAVTTNNELQTYVGGQSKVQPGKILLTADKLDGQYISGMAESSMAFRYGTFAFRIHTVNGAGLFPAIWMLPAADETYPEIDIYELIGSRPYELYGVCHYLDEENHKSRDYFQHVFPENRVPENYVIRFEWTHDSLSWYLNDALVYTTSKYVPDIPMYMIFNLAVGGDWPGTPDQNTVFPATFQAEVLTFAPEETFTR